MFSSDQYELLDFGRGRKLERFAGRVVDRPSPSADGFEPRSRTEWRGELRFERRNGERGEWDRLPAGSLSPWTVRHGSVVLELKPNEFGHVGVFPEQATNWDWLADQVRLTGRIKVLNLFAYTGGSTLAAAAAGAEVVHVDAARNVVQWARRNAELSGLAEAPIRWITEDATKFVQRELRRGNTYHAVILDPPSYGHGPRGEPWKLADHLPTLLADCARLTEPERAFLLVTCHSPELGPGDLRSLMANCCQVGRQQVEAGELTIRTADGRELPSGVVLRLRHASGRN